MMGVIIVRVKLNDAGDTTHLAKMQILTGKATRKIIGVFISSLGKMALFQASVPTHPLSIENR